MLKVGDILDNRYRIESILLSNDQKAIIWRAYDRHIERYVAVKTLKDLERLTRIQHEALTSGVLEHPHLIPIYDYSIKSSPPYLVMQLVSNQRLSDLIGTRRLAAHEILRLAQRLGDALDYLHHQKVIHGDFRPLNILIGTQNQPYITNLSVSTAIDDAGTAINVGQGSYYFMAPEQLSAAKIDYRADIYAFGVVLFNMLTGRLPFGSEGRKSSLAIKQQVNPEIGLPSIRLDRPELPIGVDMVLNRLIRFVPEERYKSASEAVIDLERAFYSGQSSIEGQIFISYARKDSDYVYTLAKELRRIGLDIWIDQDIDPGANWDDSIEDALEACNKMLLIVSPDSVISGNVQDEWSYFLEQGKAVYPFIYAECKIPFRLRRRQYITGTSDLLSDVARIVDVLAGGNPTKLNTFVE